MTIELLNQTEVIICGGGNNICYFEGGVVAWPPIINNIYECQDIVCNQMRAIRWEYSGIKDPARPNVYINMYGFCPTYIKFMDIIARRVLGNEFVNKNNDP